MKKIGYWLLFALAILAVGCGGGGGGGGASGGASIFLTDDLSTNYTAVWVKIHRVELERQGGGRVTVFEDSVGKVINLRALNDGSPRFAFLGKDSVPEDTYVGIRFTLDKDVSLVPTGSSNALARVFDDPYINPANPEQAFLSITFPGPKSVSGSETNFVCDFVLSQWKDNGAKIHDCRVDDGPHDGLGNGDRHHHDEWEGNIANLEGTSPNFTFTLNLRSGNRVTVTTDSSTAIYNSNGSPNPELANGKRVHVRGAFNPTSKSVAARAVKIKNNPDNEDPHEVKGLAKEVNAEAGTFDVTLGEAEGFIPTADFVHVTTTTGTRFFSHGGILLTREQFFAILVGGGKRVEAEGVWDSATNTLAAVKAKIEDEENDHEAEARGASSNPNLAAGTFTITLDEWEGFSSSRGAPLNVQTTGSTKFRNGEGQEISKEQFFTLLASNPTVKVEGAYLEGTITAKYARIRTSGGGGGGSDPHEAQGAVLNINAGAKTFDLLLTEWEGFPGSANMLVHVQFTAGATFRGWDGESLTAEAFFSKLENGILVEAEGVFSSGTSTLTAVKAKLED